MANLPQTTLNNFSSKSATSFKSKFVECLILPIFILGIFGSPVSAREGVVKVGVYNNPPILFKDGNGQYKGLSIEILEHIASKEGWDLEYVSGTWSECLERLESGKTDIQVYIAYSKKRSQKYDFTNETLFSNWGQVFSQPGSDIDSILDLEQKTIALLKRAIHNSAFRELISKLGIKGKIIEVDSNDSVLRLIEEKKADAGVVNRVFGDTQARNFNVKKTSIIFNPIEIHYAAPKGKSHNLITAIDRHLAALKKDKGSICYLSLNKTFGVAGQSVIPRWVKLTITFGTGLLLIVLFSSIVLKRQVKLKTSELMRKTSALEEEMSDRKQAEEALRESEERYRTFFEQDSDGVVILDPETAKPIEFNDQVCRQLGYSKEEFALLRVSDIEAKETAKETQAHIQKIQSEGYDDFETLQRTKQGEIRHVHVTAQVIEIAGRPVYHCIWRDITDRKKAEEQIKASLKEKEVLLSEIHHRVKNNMQVIISLLNLQAGKIEDKKYADMLKESQNRILSMALVHEQLYQSKDFANIDFGKYIKGLVNGLFTSHGVDTNKIKLNIDINDISFDLENAIPCGLIINELVSNSLKHAFPQEKQGNIIVGLRSINEDGIVLTVKDDGVGIPEDLDMEQTDTMGLQLVKVLAEQQLDGKINLDRTNGTQFNIKFKRTAYKPRI